MHRNHLPGTDNSWGGSCFLVRTTSSKGHSILLIVRRQQPRLAHELLMSPAPGMTSAINWHVCCQPSLPRLHSSTCWHWFNQYISVIPHSLVSEDEKLTKQIGALLRHRGDTAAKDVSLLPIVCRARMLPFPSQSLFLSISCMNEEN